MKECWLQIDGGEKGAYEVKATGYSTLDPGIEVEARLQSKMWRSRPGWCCVRIGEIVGHVGSGCNRGGAVYAATRVRDYPEAVKQMDLFAAPERREAGDE